VTSSALRGQPDVDVRISIVVRPFNEEKLIANSLRRIHEAATAFVESGWETELIVCDNNSRDRTAELAKAAGATVVFEPVNQISRARNRGAEAASGDWLIFVDADSYPSRELFAGVARLIRRGRCLAGGAIVRLAPPMFWAGLWVGCWNFFSRALRWPAGSFIFCETRAFRQLGGFSLDLFVAEEIDFGQRVKRLARQRGREVVILSSEPLATSSRKMHLYPPGELFGFFLRSVWLRGQNFKDRAACAPWYDGRR